MDTLVYAYFAFQGSVRSQLCERRYSSRKKGHHSWYPKYSYTTEPTKFGRGGPFLTSLVAILCYVVLVRVKEIHHAYNGYLATCLPSWWAVPVTLYWSRHNGKLLQHDQFLAIVNPQGLKSSPSLLPQVLSHASGRSDTSLSSLGNTSEVHSYSH